MGNSNKSESAGNNALISISRSEDNWYTSITNRIPSFQEKGYDDNELITINELVDSVPGIGNSKIRSKSQLSVRQQQKMFRIYLQIDDDIWHKVVCRRNAELADKIVTFVLTSKYMWIWLGIVFIIAILFRFIKALETLQPVPAILTSVWMLLHIFTFNTKMTWKMLQSWEVWFKMFNWIIAIISYIILYNPPLQYEFGNWIAGTILIAMLSLHDAWRLKSHIKIIIGLMSWSLIIVLYLFVYFNGNCWVCGDRWEYESKYIKFLFGETISYKSLCLGGLQNLVIFVGKQLYGKIRHDKYRASVYSTAPRIRWVEREYKSLPHEAV